MSDHPNDQVFFVQYPDTGTRQVYPRLATRPGNPNAQATESVLSAMVAKLPTPLPEPPTPPIPEEIALDPEAAAYLAAGWLG